MFDSPYFFPILNFSLFSGLLICQFLIEPLFNPWIIGISALGAAGNLLRLLVVFRSGSGKVVQQASPGSEEKSAIMSDLEKEIVRRREIEKVEKN
jgi:hypothetical protein